MRSQVIVALALTSVLLISNAAVTDAAVDPIASYSGPFDAASNFEEIVQEFWVHVENTEFGRIVTAEIGVSVARPTWSAIKSSYADPLSVSDY